MTATNKSMTAPRFGGVLWSLARRTTRFALPLAGKRWNPLFAVVIHRGRRTGVERVTPVAARRVPGGFVVSLAFGAQADWHRNLLAAGGGWIRWRGMEYRVDGPRAIDATEALPAFNPIQRLALRASAIHGFVLLPVSSPAVP
jgi:deazaflavin-dependent oxidoreductase (nitroreductase family)